MGKQLYKVIGEKDRRSAVLENLNELMYANTKMLFSTKFPVGEVVQSRPDAMGFMCFENLEEALRFRNTEGLSNNSRKLTIIKVEALAPVRPISMVIGISDLITYSKLRRQHRKIWGSIYIGAPYGTVCCTKLRVLT